MSGVVVVTIPGPILDCLSPNARCDRHLKADAIGLARRAAYLWTREALIAGGGTSPLAAEGDLAVQWLIEHSGRARPRDFDNLVASMKPYLDGIFDGLATDDRRVAAVMVRQRAGAAESRVTCRVSVLEEDERWS
ncbi:MAG: hypothetical protein ACR2J8_05035 [Thermomicrobiales bacterium]